MKKYIEIGERLTDSNGDVVVACSTYDSGLQTTITCDKCYYGYMTKNGKRECRFRLMLKRNGEGFPDCIHLTCVDIHSKPMYFGYFKKAEEGK